MCSRVTQRLYAQVTQKWCIHMENYMKRRQKQSNDCKRSEVLKWTVSKVTKIQKQLTSELLTVNVYTTLFSYFDPNVH